MTLGKIFGHHFSATLYWNMAFSSKF